MENIEEPLIPAHYMLFLAFAGLVIAALVLFTQPDFSLIGWGGIGLSAISLVIWGLMAPDQAKAVLMGRTSRFGGTALIVTLIFLLALIGVYSVVKGQQWRADLTQKNEFTLPATARAEIAKLAADPTKPAVKLLAFYGIGQAGRRDRDTVLFDDYVSASAGKITYEFIDPDRNPLLLEKYKDADTGVAPAPGEVIVGKVDAAGEIELASAEIVSFVTQRDLTNALLRVSTSGDFRAYFLSVSDGLRIGDTAENGLSTFNKTLQDRLKWTTREVTLFDLTNPTSDVRLTGSGADGVVLVIPGGTRPLPDEQLKAITDYLDGGGDLVIFAGLSLEGTPLAAAENLSAYLYENFGLRVNNDLVLDETNAFQSPLIPVVSDFSRESLITQVLQAGGLMLFEAVHSIEISDTLPANVRVVPLARTASTSYSKSDLAAVASGDLKKADNDPAGPFVVAASAENTQTGARVVIFGSEGTAANRFEAFIAANIQNLNVALFSLVWATNYDAFFTNIPQIDTQFGPSDTPLAATDSEMRNFNLLTIVILPVVILGIGLGVWWNNRERDVTREKGA